MKSYKFILLFLLLASQARTQSSVCFQRLSEDASGFYVTVSYSCEQRCVSDISFGYYLISPSGQIISKSTALTRYDFPAGIGTKVIFITNQQSNPEGQLVYLQLNIAVFDANNPGLGSGFSFARNSRDQLFCSDGKGGNCCFYPTPLSNVACNISATSTTEPVICSGGLGSASLTVTGGRLPPYAYAWSNGATTSTINAPSGTYSVTVTDASGSCSITKDNIVIEDKKLSIITTAQARVCGAPKGTASATVTGGRGPYLYEWNNLNNTRGLTVSYTSITEPPGTYRVQIIDAANCSVTADIVIEDGCACNLSLSATKGSESGCPNNPMAEHLVVLQGVSSGSVSFNYKLSSTSANSTFTPQYLNNSLSTAIIWTIPPGKYLIEVEDALHCKKSLNFEYISNCPLDCMPHIDNCRTEWQQFLLQNYANGQCKVKIWETDCNTTSSIRRNGKVAIGANLTTVPNGFNLAVQGGVIANEVKVKLCSNGAWCDYVFDKKYKLMPLLEVDNYIQQNKRLPNMPSTASIEKEDGYEIKKLTLLQQEKIEEAYLHLISIEEKVKDLQTKTNSQRQRNNRISQLLK